MKKTPIVDMAINIFTTHRGIFPLPEEDGQISDGDLLAHRDTGEIYRYSTNHSWGIMRTKDLTVEEFSALRRAGYLGGTKGQGE